MLTSISSTLRRASRNRRELHRKARKSCGPPYVPPGRALSRCSHLRALVSHRGPTRAPVREGWSGGRSNLQRYWWIKGVQIRVSGPDSSIGGVCSRKYQEIVFSKSAPVRRNGALVWVGVSVEGNPASLVSTGTIQFDKNGWLADQCGIDGP